jgi:membrane-associated phospholipid phosphatase
MVEWAVVAAILLLDIAFAKATGVPIVDWHERALGIAIVATAWPATALLIRFTGLAQGAQSIAEIVPKALSYIAVASVLEYYLAATTAPLHDDLLIRIDLAAVYFNLQRETMGVLLVIAVFYPARARRFTTALIISSLFTIPLLRIFPVAGAFIGFKDVPTGCVTEVAQAAQAYMDLRTHTMSSIDVATLTGIVSFPSYHATSAVLLAYFLRGIRFVFPAAIVFNGVMVVAALPIGGHYLTDVLAGLVVAAATIYAVERIEGGQMRDRLPLWRPDAEADAERSRV